MMKMVQHETDFIQQGIHFLIIPLMLKPVVCSRQELVAQIVETALRIPERFHLTQTYTRLDGCVTFQDNYIEYAVEVQKMLHLPGFDPQGVDIACDKLLFRQSLLQAGNFGVIHSCSLSDYLDDHNVPSQLQNTTVVLKPTNASGTLTCFISPLIIHLPFTRMIFFVVRQRRSFSLFF
jgi:hypothetical protein